MSARTGELTSPAEAVAAASLLADELADRLHALQGHGAPADLKLDQWRLVVDTGTSAEIGLKDNMIGGPYDAPNVVTGTRGEVYLRWSDGRISTGSVDRTTLPNWEDDLVMWRQAAHADAFAPDVLGPQDAPDVPLFDPEVASLVFNDPAPMFEILMRFLRELPPYEADLITGSVTASVHGRRWRTSAGLDHHSAGTSFMAYADCDHRAHDYVSVRRRPGQEPIDAMIARLGETNRRLRQTATLPTGRQRVWLAPPVAEAMFTRFLIGNLDGQRVTNGAGAFALEQFAADGSGEALFHPDFGLAVDPTQPFSPGAYHLTREGVPARPYALVADGRLRSPLLDLKHARKTGMSPTPFPRGGSSLVLAGPRNTAEAAIVNTPSGLWVSQILGLHTQDAARGNFSLVVTQGLVIADGAFQGHAKALMAGNFFTALREGLLLADVPGRDFPAIGLEVDLSPG